MHERSAIRLAACMWLGAPALLATANGHAESIERVALLVAGERGSGPLATHRETELHATRRRDSGSNPRPASGRAAAMGQRAISREDGRVDD